MADFLSRLAARTLGVASVAQPATASMFAQGSAPVGNYPLEAWQEHESADDIPASSANMALEKGESAFSHAMPHAQSFMLQANPPAELPEISFSSPEGPGVNKKANDSQHLVPGVMASKRAAPLVSGHTVLLAPEPTALVLSKEESFYPDQPTENSIHLAQRSSFRGEQRVARGHLGELRSQPDRTIHTAETIHIDNDGVPLSNVNESYTTASERGQRTFMSRRSSVRHNSMNNNARESLVGQERRTITQSAHMLEGRPGRDPEAQPVVSSRPDDAGTLLPTDAPHKSIIPAVTRSQSLAGNGQRTEAQVIESPEPTIQVTISRIEVRAAPPPPEQPQSQQRAAPPVMSLDQYLQQRSKGGER